MDIKKPNPLNPIESIANLFRYAKKHGWQKTLEDWKYNYIMQDTPEQLLTKEIYGYIGMMGALLLAIVILSLNGFWYIALVMLFSIWIAYAQFKGRLKQRKQLIDIKKQLKEAEQENGIQS